MSGGRSTDRRLMFGAGIIAVLVLAGLLVWALASPDGVLDVVQAWDFKLGR